ncbi:chaperonin 10-like protein [Triangularia verruculosa]|uniref:Chaperonin 10-like protein n=1 Tax=Triangularia verruculosa TaxID=2587418 RepID=A0AAN6XG22_9PEZI|nr:chaperonin 10-like protein [Triangularia verruculosa]
MTIVASPKTHPSIVLPAPSSPPVLLQAATHTPNPNEALIKVTWTCSTPLDLHRSDGNLAISSFPFHLGTAFAGTVISLWLRPTRWPTTSLNDQPLKEGDKVFGFVSDGNEREAGFQEYVTVPVHKVSKLPANVPYGLKEAVTIPTNLVTAFHALTADLGLRLPWPKPKSFRGGDKRVLIWGGASSVGLYTIQVLKYWGYTNVIAVASGKHHEELRRLGARVCFDYRNSRVLEEIERYLDKEDGSRQGGPIVGARIPYFVDCIGSRDGTLRPLSEIAERGSKVAVMLPVINVHAAEGRRPVFAADEHNVEGVVWRDGVEVKGVRTLNYEENMFFREKLQPVIIPALLAQGAIQPNRARVVEGATLLERAHNALQLLREQSPSGERLVWRVSEDER